MTEVILHKDSINNIKFQNMQIHLKKTTFSSFVYYLAENILELNSVQRRKIKQVWIWPCFRP